jgi:hypothetical protein
MSEHHELTIDGITFALLLADLGHNGTPEGSWEWKLTAISTPAMHTEADYAHSRDEAFDMALAQARVYVDKVRGR